MKVLGLLVVVALAVAIQGAPKREKRALLGLTGGALIGAIKSGAAKITGSDVMKKLGNGLLGVVGDLTDAIFEGHFKHTDEVIEERLIRFTPKSETAVMVVDMDTQIRALGTGKDMQEATANGLARLWTQLIRRGKISEPPTVPPSTKRPCHDKYGRYCAQYARKGYCERGSAFHSFMRDYCRATCTGCTDKEHY